MLGFTGYDAKKMELFVFIVFDLGFELGFKF